jgi:hypothetical protein
VLVDNASTTKAVVALGGNSIPGLATITLGNKLKAGKYHLVIKVTDKIGGESDSFDQEFSLLAPTFTSVQQRFFLDAKGEAPTGTSGIVGQKLFYRLGMIGMDRSKDKIDLTLEVEALDEEGKQVYSNTTVEFKKDVAEEVKKISFIHFDGFLVLNRTGAFMLRFKFADVAGNQKSEIEFPLDVREP